MTREGLDGINSDAQHIATLNPQIVAYYIDGPYAWTQNEINMFPNSVHIRIATRASTNDGHFLDCETGDATPTQAAQWAHTRRGSGYAFPGIYTSISNQDTVINAFNLAHEPLPLWWLAHYDNLDVLPNSPGVVGKQYASLAQADKSIWADSIPGIDGEGVIDMDLNNQLIGDSDGHTVNDALLLIVREFEESGNSFYQTTLPDFLNNMQNAIVSLNNQLAAIQTQLGALQQGGTPGKVTGTWTFTPGS